jgi:hypothetical protein
MSAKLLERAAVLQAALTVTNDDVQNNCMFIVLHFIFICLFTAKKPAPSPPGRKISAHEQKVSPLPTVMEHTNNKQNNNADQIDFLVCLYLYSFIHKYYSLLVPFYRLPLSHRLITMLIINSSQHRR